jgi:aryl-alcohol dehydrogenase-like predicted oxidoreductase
MEFSRVGDSDLKLSAVIFGAWAAGGWMWGGTDVRASIEAVRASIDLGATSVDTAPVYGQGASEEIVGEAIQGIPRDRIQILTKYGMRWDDTRGTFFFKSRNNAGKEIDIYKYAGKESVIDECENSLRRLKTDYIDLYQIHWHDATTPIEETMEAVQRLIDQGKVRSAGVCNYAVEWIKTAEKAVHCVSNQVPYSMLTRGIEKDIIPYCIETRKGVLAYSPMERGLLTGKMKPGYVFAKGDHRVSHKYFTAENIKRINLFLEKILPIAKSKNASLGQVVLRWVLDQPGITAVLAGARNKEQAIQNVRAADLKLSPDEHSAIDVHLAELKLV